MGCYSCCCRVSQGVFEVLLYVLRLFKVYGVRADLKIHVSSIVYGLCLLVKTTYVAHRPKPELALNPIRQIRLIVTNLGLEGALSGSDGTELNP